MSQPDVPMNATFDLHAIMKQQFTQAAVIDKELKLRSFMSGQIVYSLENLSIMSNFVHESIEKQVDDVNTRSLVIEFLRSIVEAMFEFIKCLLLDAELRNYSQSLVIAGLFSATIEIKLHDLLHDVNNS